MVSRARRAFAQTPPPAGNAPPAAARRLPCGWPFLDLQRIAGRVGRRQGRDRQGAGADPEEDRRARRTRTRLLRRNQQKLQQGGAVLNEAARAQTQKEIDRLHGRDRALSAGRATRRCRSCSSSSRPSSRRSCGRSSTRWSRSWRSVCSSARAMPARSTSIRRSTSPAK